MFGSLLNSIRSKASSQNCNRTRLWVSVHHILAMAPFAFVCVVVFWRPLISSALLLPSKRLDSRGSSPCPNMEHHPDNDQATNVWIRSCTRQSPRDTRTWTFMYMDGTQNCDNDMFGVYIMESTLNAKYEADDCLCLCVKNNTPSKDRMTNAALLQDAVSNGWPRERLL